LPAEQWPAEEPEQRRLIPPPAEPMSWELREARQAMEEGIITESPRLNRAAAGGILTLALVVLLAAFVLSFRRAVCETLIRLGETFSGEDRKQVVPPQTDAAANPASEAPAATAPPTSPANAPAQKTADQPNSQAANAGTSPPSASPPHNRRLVQILLR